MKKLNYFVPLFLAFCGLSTTAFAAGGNVKACVRYERDDYSWSETNAVKGYFLSQNDVKNLAKRKGYDTDDFSYSSYFVVVWKEGGYTRLKLKNNKLYPYEIDVKDQHNRNWKIKQGWADC